MSRQDCTKNNFKNLASSSRLLQVSDSFQQKASFKFSLVYPQAGNKVHAYLVQSSVFWVSALFSIAGSKIQFIFYPTLWNCFWMRLYTRRFPQIIYFFCTEGVFSFHLHDVALQLSIAMSLPFKTTQKVNPKTWSIRSNLAIVPTVLFWVLFKILVLSCCFPSPCLIAFSRPLWSLEIIF